MVELQEEIKSADQHLSDDGAREEVEEIAFGTIPIGQLEVNLKQILLFK